MDKTLYQDRVYLTRTSRFQKAERMWRKRKPLLSVAIITGENVGKVRNLVRINHRMIALHIALFTSALVYSSVAQ